MCTVVRPVLTHQDEVDSMESFSCRVHPSAKMYGFLVEHSVHDGKLIHLAELEKIFTSRVSSTQTKLPKSASPVFLRLQATKMCIKVS